MPETDSPLLDRNIHTEPLVLSLFWQVACETLTLPPLLLSDPHLSNFPAGTKQALTQARNSAPKAELDYEPILEANNS